MTDFINLKIKSVKSFKYAYRGKVCVCIFIGVSVYMCMSIWIYSVFF
jgi:hypothetical protein